jgi:hypothetical protein
MILDREHDERELRGLATVSDVLARILACRMLELGNVTALAEPIECLPRRIVESLCDEATVLVGEMVAAGVRFRL